MVRFLLSLLLKSPSQTKRALMKRNMEHFSPSIHQRIMVRACGGDWCVNTSQIIALVDRQFPVVINQWFNTIANCNYWREIIDLGLLHSSSRNPCSYSLYQFQKWSSYMYCGLAAILRFTVLCSSNRNKEAVDDFSIYQNVLVIRICVSLNSCKFVPRLKAFPIGMKAKTISRL